MCFGWPEVLCAPGDDRRKLRILEVDALIRESFGFEDRQAVTREHLERRREAKPQRITSAGAPRRPRAVRPRRAASVAAPQLMHVRGQAVYVCPGRRLHGKDRCGALLDQLLALLAAKPAYVHPLDAKRYAALLPRLAAFVMHTGWGESRRTVAVADLPMTELHGALEDWIYSYLRSESLLMPSFALDAARFTAAHAWGQFFYPSGGGEPWEIKALLTRPQSIPFWPAIGREKGFKRSITSALKGCIVRFRLPPRGALWRAGAQAPLLASGGGCAAIERCHLSEGFFDDVSLEAREEPPMRHDIADELRFMVSLRKTTDVEKLMDGPMWPPAEQGRQLELPGRWITDALVRPKARGSKAYWEKLRWTSARTGAR